MFDEVLADYEVFRQVAVDPENATLTEPNRTDLSPRTLYPHSHPSVPAGRAR